MIQFALAFFGVMAVLMMYTPSYQLKRWSPIVGLMGQPFWAAFAYATEPTPWGLWFTCVLFSCSFSYGIYRQWFVPQSAPPVFREIGILDFGNVKITGNIDISEVDGKVLYTKDD